MKSFSSKMDKNGHFCPFDGFCWKSRLFLKEIFPSGKFPEKREIFGNFRKNLRGVCREMVPLDFSEKWEKSEIFPFFRGKNLISSTCNADFGKWRKLGQFSTFFKIRVAGAGKLRKIFLKIFQI